MPSILLYNLRPEPERFIRDAMANTPCTIDAFKPFELCKLDSRQNYCLIFAEVDFENVEESQRLLELRNRMDRCLTIFIFYESRHDLIKKSYLQGDGAIVFPMDMERFHRILQWYISTGETRFLERIKERKRSTFSGWRSFIAAHKGMLAILILAALILGAFIGFYCANISDGGQKAGASAIEKIRRGLYELQK
jgi:hypothetical protein